MEAEAKIMNSAMKSMPDKEGKYLTFSLAGQEYGISILMVREITGMTSIRTVVNTPPYIKGVINLRGKIIPIVDLRSKFDLEATDYTERTCIVVVEIMESSGIAPIGIIVDSVSEVLNVKNSEIEETPAFGLHLNKEYILGMAKMTSGVKILLDICRVLGGEQMEDSVDNG